MAEKKMTRIKQSPKLPAEERREQLLKAAHDLFQKKGYRATTTDEIAKKAGVTKGGLYFHFDSKEDILLAFVREIIDAHAASLSKLKDRNLSPADLLTEMRRIDHDMPLAESRRNLSLLAEVIQIPRFRKLMNEAYERSMQTMAESLDPAYGRTKQQRRQVVELTHALYDGICFAGMIHPQLGDFDRQLKVLTRLVETEPKRK